MKRVLVDMMLITLGVSFAAFGLGAFLMPNRFIDGGVVGISLLVAEISTLSISLLVVILNVPFIVLGYRMIGKDFALKTTAGILLLALALAFVPFPFLTNDKLLVAIFGGCFLGIGIGFAIRGGGVLDGSEVLAVALSRNLGLTVGDFILSFNLILFSVAVFVLSLETALYAALTYFATTRMVDLVVEGNEEFTGVTIVSGLSEEIRGMLINKMGSGVTMYKATGGYRSIENAETESNVVFTVIARLEINKLYTELDLIDPHAFVFTTSIKETRGGRVRRRPPAH